MAFYVLEATPDDGDDLMSLLPRLGAFPRPAHRAGDEIHREDAEVVRRWRDGGEPDIAIVIARDDSAPRQMLGFAIVRMRPDVLNREPSGHLEALAVADGAEGKGVGTALIERSEQVALARGATTMTLHVFRTNERAIALYERHGYTAEWIRYFKPLAPRSADESS